MRRFALFLLCFILLLGLCIPVSAANYASKVNITATVGSDKSCQVTVSAALHIQENDGNINFPIPPEATDVRLNNSRIRTTKTKQAQLVSLSDSIGNMTGDLTVTITYTLPNVITTGAADTPQLQLPMLSGFQSSISQLDFSVSLPGQLQGKPAFSSGYHQADIEKELTYTVTGSTVVGGSTGELKDHETLTMYLAVEESWFPDAPLEFFESDADAVAMVICAVLALIYWFAFLRFLPPKKKLCPTVPEGITAGQLGAVLTLGKADLSLMVLSWAQLGYVQIQSGSKRVVLHKKMDMGNERTALEQAYFKKLFGTQDTVDTDRVHYAALCRNLAKQSLNLQAYVHKRSGNPRLFRAICALIGLFGGVSFGIAMTQEAAIQGFWIFLTAVIGLLCGYQMQAPIAELLLRKSGKTALGLVFTAVWLILGLIAGQFGLAIIVMLARWLAGAMVFYGGRRTEEGKQEFARILGLRQFLKTVSKEELRRIQTMDPEYFHVIAPYAFALGVGRSFAQRFGKAHIPDCPYISCRSDNIHTARQWAEKINATLSNMNRRSRLLPLERFMALFNIQTPKKRRKK